MFKDCKWIDFDFCSNTLSCKICGKKQRLKSNMDLSNISPEIERFIKIHKRCKGISAW